MLQRCPHFTSHVFAEPLHDPNQVLLMNHQRGIPLDAAVATKFTNQVEHDPDNLAEARALSERTTPTRSACSTAMKTPCATIWQLRRAFMFLQPKNWRR